ncbi:excinuclease ABC subunit UvrA [Clostridium tagluense]|uniref:ATP-binding cassette domain-containing protein n=1 Tax=Clostridium tagluense TaxID=360422 RepID=UPI001CF38E07|nr:excinuclease ABC subunit UvrA [Clostridium tagluense]MCB2311391.1 excinuclease ABC subunit UvrA [Clostridium tagluense]MCB2316115.1 excinuclease ABC subunit UvrA [Clostridium tagluense]MCB2321082.1 excinuclease ABC subunit UvrA [Clostridium tagluense]MCB2326098.1 excinuclease ABC subunit UvrA [Clostridium tagluense]MCB2330821.1 excinuclease ABC subunit UvrA [Clostridium tagluense]
MGYEYIEIIGARENNLKNINLNVPKGQITIFTGVSGSGKSSIVFDTIAQEAGRQLNETFSKFVQAFMPKYRHPDVDAIKNLSLAIIVQQKRIGGNSRSTLGTITDIDPIIRLLFSRIGQPHIGPSSYFSFNDPNGMCKTCEGIGKIVTLDLDKALDKEKSLNQGAILLPGFKVGNWIWKSYAATGFFDCDKKIKDYTKEEYDKLVFCKEEKIKSPLMEDINTTYLGLVERFIRSNIKTEFEKSEAAKKKIAPFTTEGQCDDCCGKRYNKTVLSSKIMGYTIADFTAMQVDSLLEQVQKIEEKKVKPIIDNLSERLNDLIQIGLDYVSLNRETSTLSGGESQRVKMVKHLTGSLINVMYIFDEPSIGLHARDVHRLNELLVKLRDKDNTVIVVEHDPDVIKIADHIVDVGPKAGINGGRVMFEGSYNELLSSNTLTGEYIGRSLQIKSKPRISTDFYETKKSNLHNLKNVSLKIPKGIFSVVSGVAGSGKSTLVNGVFANEYKDAIIVDQSAVSANLRSNPATFTGIMDMIRKSFADENKVSAGLFSYNSEGACEACKGRGFIETDLSFMNSVETICEECGGKRFKREVLDYKCNKKSIVEVLDMTIAEAVEFFTQKEVRSKLKHIADVGLHYMTLGQPLDTLSGGESQRLKLARELSKKGNIYIMDEPTTGLHMSDITSILKIIDRLVDKGNTVIVVEHNLDVIRNADWVVDMGVEGGSRGGQIIFEGTPADLKNCKESITARYL